MTKLRAKSWRDDGREREREKGAGGAAGKKRQRGRETEAKSEPNRVPLDIRVA